MLTTEMLSFNSCEKRSSRQVDCKALLADEGGEASNYEGKVSISQISIIRAILLLFSNTHNSPNESRLAPFGPRHVFMFTWNDNAKDLAFLKLSILPFNNSRTPSLSQFLGCDLAPS